MSPTHTNHEVRIIWHGHSCFELNSEEAVIVIDPYHEVPGYGQLELQADAVLTSHDHGDHNARELVQLSSRSPKFELEVIDTHHDNQQGKLRGKNKIHIVTLAGKRIAHLGDLGHTLSPAQLDQLQDLDVMLIPVGGHFTIDADTAADIVKRTKPDIVVPMHYREGGAGFDVITTVHPFLEHFDKVTRYNRSEFTVGDYHDSVLVLQNPKMN